MKEKNIKNNKYDEIEIRDIGKNIINKITINSDKKLLNDNTLKEIDNKIWNKIIQEYDL